MATAPTNELIILKITSPIHNPVQKKCINYQILNVASLKFVWRHNS